MQERKFEKRVGFTRHHSFERSDTGFTLIEIVIALAIIGILIVVFTIYINPAQRLAETRNNERTLHINTILNAVGQNISNNSGTFSCSAGAIPTTTARIMASTTASTYNIYDCLIPEFLSAMPVDPQTGTMGNSSTTYNTKYSIIRNATTSQITITAPDAELGEIISVTR